MSSLCLGECRCIFRAWHIVIYILVRQKEISNFTGFHSCISIAMNRKKRKEEKDLMKKFTGSSQFRDCLAALQSHGTAPKAAYDLFFKNYDCHSTPTIICPYNQLWGCCSIPPHIFHISTPHPVGLSLLPTPPVFIPSPHLLKIPGTYVGQGGQVASFWTKRHNPRSGHHVGVPTIQYSYPENDGHFHNCATQPKNGIACPSIINQSSRDFWKVNMQLGCRMRMRGWGSVGWETDLWGTWGDPEWWEVEHWVVLLRGDLRDWEQSLH